MACETVHKLRLFLIFLLSFSATIIFFSMQTTNRYIQEDAYHDSNDVLFGIKDDERQKIANQSQKIAIGMGMSTRKMKAEGVITLKKMETMPFFKFLLPSFCKTVTKGFYYGFYITYDYNDPVLSFDKNIKLFRTKFKAYVNAKCPKGLELELNFYSVNYTKKPAWAQNDAMMAAYLEDNDYYYRVNDDTEFETKNWVIEFIHVLSQYKPKNIGVVGPSFKRGNTGILTYDFVHRTHVDMFGFYYPRLFEGWHADRWISDVYKPGRSTKDKAIWIKHVESLGQRYPSHSLPKANVRGQIGQDQETLKRFVDWVSRNDSNKNNYRRRSTHVISYSLPDNSADAIHGLVRNAILARVFFPTWTAQVILPSDYHLPPNVLQKIYKSGMVVKHINNNSKNKNNTIDKSIPQSLYKYLVIDDTNVEMFLIRDARSRLNLRDAFTVNKWEVSGFILHSVKDHPDHNNTILNMLHWGGIRTYVHQKLLKGTSIVDTLTKICKTSPDKCRNEASLLKDILPSDISTSIYYHSSISCINKTANNDNKDNIHDITIPRINREFLGQFYNSVELPTSQFPKNYVKTC